MPTRWLMYINGEFVEAAGREYFNDYDPSTGRVFAEVPTGRGEDVKLAIDAAYAALPAWASTPPSARRLCLLRAADIMERRFRELVNALVEETGSTLRKAMFEVEYSINLVREAASSARGPSGEILSSDLPKRVVLVTRRPLGVVGVITPWNFPLLLALRAVAFALACGNAVVLKPAPDSAVSGGLMIAEGFHEAKLPKGVLNVVTCPDEVVEEVCDELITDPRVRGISFTGSTEVGRSIGEKAGRYFKKVVLELGGSDPILILKDADVDYAVNAAVFGRFFHQGQICMASKRIIVEEPVAQGFIEKFVKRVQGLKVGDPREPDTVIGPIINQEQLDKLKAQVEDALAKGAKLLCGGKHKGLYYYPTVLVNITREMRVYYEEVFGPVAPVIVVKDEEEAVKVANDTIYGLSAGVITGDIKKGLEVAERIESGMVHINDSSVYDEPHFPFGGIKASGLGRHGGRIGLEEFFTEVRCITIQREARTYPF
ncbi:MAG: aldehyde dehydrogenase family protein [Candidatus Nezhaarchaeota archaeon]|nr:aldehyde dehydrogenase family protein [Candidatus Nezhaarchaeota archaeon]